MREIDQLFQTFLSIKSAEGRADSTLKQYRDNYGYFSTFLADNTGRAIDKKLFREYVLYMREELHLAPSTINTRLKTLRVMFRCLYDEEIINAYPLKTFLTPVKRSTS
ncbi:phage integrase SAM-like domain-containing protein [Halobacillus sp. Marseille-Q1614]|uniref:phage integrase SAM-like domain-containing protein n=1 Tax=Halobacillus sp. Marseille-Q1614 TaxID=2709134 RepID=UPI0015712A36